MELDVPVYGRHAVTVKVNALCTIVKVNPPMYRIVPDHESPLESDSTIV